MAEHEQGLRRRRNQERKPRQAQFGFPNGWGGRRKGAGPKPGGERAGVSHRTRAPLAARFPVEVTMRVRAGLPSLRGAREYAALRAAITAGCERGDFRLVHFSVQSNHLHLIVEGACRSALSRGMQGLTIRMARALNRLWRRFGSVFADRYYDRILRSPREVWNALRYVLCNARKHGRCGHAPTPVPPPRGSTDGATSRPRQQRLPPQLARTRGSCVWAGASTACSESVIFLGSNRLSAGAGHPQRNELVHPRLDWAQNRDSRDPVSHCSANVATATL